LSLDHSAPAQARVSSVGACAASHTVVKLGKREIEHEDKVTSMTLMLNIHEAQMQLVQLLKQVRHGEEIITPKQAVQWRVWY